MQTPERQPLRALSKDEGDGKYPFSELTERIISCALEVHSALGPGLLESLHEEALARELSLRKIPCVRQQEIGIEYKGVPIGNHRIDLLVDDAVVVELNAVESLNKVHEAQLLTFLRATNKKVGLLIKFNVEHLRDGIRRRVL